VQRADARGGRDRGIGTWSRIMSAAHSSQVPKTLGSWFLSPWDEGGIWPNLVPSIN
jgi:hypothetical protein